MLEKYQYSAHSTNVHLCSLNELLKAKFAAKWILIFSNAINLPHKSPSHSAITGCLYLYLIKLIHYERSFYLKHIMSLFFWSLEMFWGNKGHSFPSPACHFIPERGYGPRWKPHGDLYRCFHLTFSLFLSILHYQVPVGWSKSEGFTENPLQTEQVSSRKWHAHKQMMGSMANIHEQYRLHRRISTSGLELHRWISTSRLDLKQWSKHISGRLSTSTQPKFD